MGFERPGSLGGRIGFLLKAGVMSHWNCVKYCCLVHKRSTVSVLVSAVERLFKYLKTLYPIYRCPCGFVENLSFGYKVIERSQSNYFQLGWKCNVEIHHLRSNEGFGPEILMLPEA